MGKELLYVFLGGGIGSVLRYGTSAWLNPIVKNFPLGTITSNVVSSLVLGILYYLFSEKTIQNENLRLLLMVGLCGGFSTFSTFTMENYQMLKQGDYLPFIMYTVASVAISLIGFFGGVMLAKLF